MEFKSLFKGRFTISTKEGLAALLKSPGQPIDKQLMNDSTLDCSRPRSIRQLDSSSSNYFPLLPQLNTKSPKSKWSPDHSYLSASSTRNTVHTGMPESIPPLKSRKNINFNIIKVRNLSKREKNWDESPAERYRSKYPLIFFKNIPS